MEEECKGCYLYRITEITPQEQIMVRCEHDQLDCPCKSCLVKVVCNFTDSSLSCPKYVEFNKKYNINEFWISYGEKEGEKLL